MECTQGGRRSRSRAGRVVVALVLAVTAPALPAALGGGEASEGSWTERAPMATTRFSGAAVTGADGKIYVVGGLTYTTSEDVGP